MTTTNNGCPTCGLSGVPPERAAIEAPRYMAALTTLTEEQSYPIPDEPSASCWSCRIMIAAGMDPAAIIALDDAEYLAQRAAR